MPGIVGFVTKAPRETAERELRQMLKAICHEPFYSTGTWIDESLGVYAGSVARKASFCDGMPVSNETGDISLLFSGEEYPDPDVRRQLKDRGHSFDAEGPSYLVHLCEDDSSFPRSLNGMFHGLVIDRGRREVRLFNDRYGMHRLYYHQAAESFYFAAEAKAILAVRPELRKADPRGLGEFVALSCVLENRTIFQDIHILPGGSAWVFRGGSLAQKHTYFDPREWEEQGTLELEPYYRELRDVFSQNLPRYFAGPERIGMTLTGGLDTRMIMAWRKAEPESLPCYTFGGMFRECRDVQVARNIAQVCQQPHQTIKVGPEFLSQFSRYAERSVYLTEGGVDVYRASDLYVSEQARRIAPVKIVGTYGSEVVRHAVMFKPMAPMPGLYLPEFLSHVGHAGETYRSLRRQHPVTFAAFRQSPWYHYGILKLEQTQLSVRSPYLDNEFVRMAYRAPKFGTGADEDVRLRLINDGSRTLGNIPSDRGVGGNAGRLTSAVSRAFFEFTFKAEYAYDYGMPQWVARIDHAFSMLHFERLFLGRHKLLHFRVWYRDALSRYLQEILLDPRALSRSYLEPKIVESIVTSHVRGEQNHTTALHKLLTLELMHRLFFDPN